MLALMVAGLSSARQAQLGQRYGCEIVDASLETCQAIQQRLVASLSADDFAELASAPAAILQAAR
jgi:hypothetical protein